MTLTMKSSPWVAVRIGPGVIPLTRKIGLEIPSLMRYHQHSETEEKYTEWVAGSQVEKNWQATQGTRFQDSPGAP